MLANVVASTNLVSQDAASISMYAKDILKITRSLGVPPKYNMDIDIQYTNEYAGGFGRVFTRTILSNPTIISICPGSVTMLPNFSKADKQDFYDNLMNFCSTNNMGVWYKMANTKDKSWATKLFDFVPNTKEYAKYLNVLCRASAILMGVGEEKMPGTNIKLKNFDYAYWKCRNDYRDTKRQQDRSIWTDFWDNGVMAAASGAINDGNYIHFFVNNQETSISESVETSTAEPAILGGATKEFRDAAANLSYYLSGKKSGLLDTAQYTDAINAGIASVTSSGAEWAKTFESIGKGLLNGGQMVFPDMISGVQYGKSISCSMDFISPYGDPLSIFLHCQIPALHLLALSLPKQLSDNMYTFPFVVRIYQQGMFNSQLAVISGIEINRGGDDGTAWTVDGLSTAWNVRITVTPLYSQLMMPSSDHPILFMKNEGMMEYLGNLCGQDLKANSLDTKLNLFRTFAYELPKSWPASFGRGIGDSLATKLGGFFKLTN